MAAEPTDELLRIAASYSPKIRNALLQSYRLFLEQVPESRIISVLKNDGIQGVMDLADILGGDVAATVTPLLTDAWMASGRKITSLLPNGAVIAPYSFDTARVSAVNAAQAYRGAFIAEITERQREAIAAAVTRGLMEGWRQSKVAQAVRASVGLTAQQEQWVANYRAQLTTLDASVLDRVLRDRRSDRMLERLMESGEALSAEQIDSLVERYRQRMVKYRAETIARTESLRSTNMGEYDSLVAAMEAGVLNPLLRRFWEVSWDERLRVYHAPIPSLNAEGRAIEEPFQTPLGPLMYPLDPNGVAANVINCRCRLVYRLPDAMGEYKNVTSTGRLPADLSDLLGDIG